MGKTFWRVYAHAVFINVAFFGFWLILTVMATHATFPAAIYALAWLIVANPYFIYGWVAVWRAGAEAGNGAWSIVARMLVVLHVVLALAASVVFIRWMLH